MKPFHTPLGLQIDEKNPQSSKCIRCDTCDGYPCLIDAKSDSQTLCVDPALRFPNVSLLTNAYVERLETTASGREISRVVVTRHGATENYSADVVVVSCGAINSAALFFVRRTRNTRGASRTARTWSDATTWDTLILCCWLFRSVRIRRCIRRHSP